MEAQKKEFDAMLNRERAEKELTKQQIIAERAQQAVQQEALDKQTEMTREALLT